MTSDAMLVNLSFVKPWSRIEEVHLPVVDIVNQLYGPRRVYYRHFSVFLLDQSRFLLDVLVA